MDGHDLDGWLTEDNTNNLYVTFSERFIQFRSTTDPLTKSSSHGSLNSNYLWVPATTVGHTILPKVMGKPDLSKSAS